MEDLCFDTETDDPAEEQGRYGNSGSKDEMLLSVGNQHHIPAEPVNDHVHKTPVEAHFHVHCIAGEHLEQPVGVLYQIFAGELRAGDSVFG